MNEEKEKIFILEVLRLCKKHGFSISHEDGHGAFMLDTFNEYNVKWLLAIGKEDSIKTHKSDYNVFTDKEIELAQQIFSEAEISAEAAVDAVNAAAWENAQSKIED